MWGESSNFDHHHHQLLFTSPFPLPFNIIMVSQSFAIIVALMLCLGFASAVKEAITIKEFPAVQTSVTSTAFNPGKLPFYLVY
jgi:hypothetical protein